MPKKNRCHARILANWAEAKDELPFNGQIVAGMETAPELVAFVDSCRPRHVPAARQAIGCRSALALNWVRLCATIERTKDCVQL
jgi:hypothetical protein